MTKTAPTSNYDYMDKTAINKDLNCEYCNNPLVEPVSTPCNHTFCRVCIENKIKKTGGTCAKPKCKNKSITLGNLTPVTQHTVLNMLDCLLVKCTRCGMTNIQRGTYEKHSTKSCPKAIVACTAVDIKCPWTGTSDQLKQHTLSCIYEQIRPAFSEILQDNRQLKEALQKMSEQCLQQHQLHIKELQETNQRLNTNIEQLNKILNHEKDQLKELIMQNKSQINELQTEIQRKNDEIIRIDERCNKHEIQINLLTDKINGTKDIYPYNNLQLEINISKCQSHTIIDLSKQQLLDRDMKTIVKQALIEKECTRLDLGYNAITSIGASILADALKQNTTLEELDFHNNRVLDIGVHSLAKVLSLNTSIVKALGLGSNGITDKGAEHLADMLKTNRTITWLALAGNQIGDRGVQLLANTLAHQNSSLLVLSLHVNKSISDASIDVIIYMLQHNKSLKKLWMQDCSISENGKNKLREVAKLKQNFSLYM
ncbi:unnamed protein product [Rotaria sp. Silwood2]|nr:unnamed protein product [Rotaria sp. Silwood2]CAF4153992.1 unnamed protein product [Rotaria sp. Silwood2]